MPVAPSDDPCLNKLYQWLQKMWFCNSIINCIFFTQYSSVEVNFSCSFPSLFFYRLGNLLLLFSVSKYIVNVVVFILQFLRVSQQGEPLNAPPSVFVHFLAFWYINSPSISPTQTIINPFFKEVSSFYWEMTFRNQELSHFLAYWRNHFTYVYFSFVIYFLHFFPAVLYY